MFPFTDASDGADGTRQSRSEGPSGPRGRAGRTSTRGNPLPTLFPIGGTDADCIAAGIEELDMLTGRSNGPSVESLMTRMPVVVTEEDAIAGVAELLAGYEITGLPVVDADERVVGVISQTDLVRLRGSTLPWTGWHGLMVRDLMTAPAKTIGASASLDEAARRMTADHVHRLVVVDDRRRPIGIISESDIVREIADCCDDA